MSRLDYAGGAEQERHSVQYYLTTRAGSWVVQSKGNSTAILTLPFTPILTLLHLQDGRHRSRVRCGGARDWCVLHSTLGLTAHG